MKFNVENAEQLNKLQEVVKKFPEHFQKNIDYASFTVLDDVWLQMKPQFSKSLKMGMPATIKMLNVKKDQIIFYLPGVIVCYPISDSEELEFRLIKDLNI